MSVSINTRSARRSNAVVLMENNNTKIVLRSYTTRVAVYEKGVLRVYGWYSQTTARHIQEFLEWLSLEADVARIGELENYDTRKKLFANLDLVDTKKRRYKMIKDKKWKSYAEQ